MTYETETRRLPINPRDPEGSTIKEASAILRNGGLVAFPTETVYGLGAAALNPDAVARIFAAKGRPAADPLIVHIAEIDQLHALTAELPPVAKKLSERFWPGPLTLVIEKSEVVPMGVTANGTTVAVRMPSHPVALALIHAAGPIAAPSANRFSRPSPTSADHVAEDLWDRVDMILDGGPVNIGVESTVLSLVTDPPTVLRPGGTPVEALREVIPNLVVSERYLSVEEEAASPGMMLKHYSPDAEVTLYEGEGDKVLHLMRADAEALIKEGYTVGLMVPEEATYVLSGLRADIISLGSIDDLESIARHLFGALRDLDSRGCDRILARAMPFEGLGLAIRDRMLRAAEGRVVTIE